MPEFYRLTGANKEWKEVSFDRPDGAKCKFNFSLDKSSYQIRREQVLQVAWKQIKESKSFDAKIFERNKNSGAIIAGYSKLCTVNISKLMAASITWSSDADSLLQTLGLGKDALNLEMESKNRELSARAQSRG